MLLFVETSTGLPDTYFRVKVAKLLTIVIGHNGKAPGFISLPPG